MSLLSNTSAGEEHAGGFYNGAATTSYRNASTAILTNEVDAPTSAKIMSFGGWIKRNKITVYSNLFSGVIAGSGHASPLYFDTSDRLNVYSYDGSAYTFEYTTTRVFRDTSAWYHIWVEINSNTNANATANRVKIHVNGIRETAFATASHIADGGPDIRGYATDGAVFTFGHADAAATSNSYFADWYFIDNSAVSPEDTVGEFKNGVFIPKKYSPTFGTNGFHLKFDQVGVGTAAATTIGADSSGKNTLRHFTSTAGTNVVASDCALPDSPENNFCTLNFLDKGADNVLADGNLGVSWNATNGQAVRGTFVVSSGKWYAEFMKGVSILTVGIATQNNNGVAADSGWMGSSAYGAGGSYSYTSTAKKYTNGNVTNYGDTYASGDIIGVAFDADNGTITFYKNGASQGQAYSSISGAFAFGLGYFGGTQNGVKAFANFGQDPSFGGTLTGNDVGDETPDEGAGVFKHDVPAGFLALCTANLPEPDIGPNSDTQATDHFNTVIWTAASVDGATKTITVGFKPDFIWGKARNRAASHMLVNSTVGFTKYQPSDGNNVEQALDSFVNNAVTATGYLLDDDEDGYFNYAPDGGTADTMVAWHWKANGGTATATISESGDDPAAVVQANPTAGFSLITYTGTGAAGTIAHGLDTAPTMMIVKNRDVNDAWAVYHVKNDAAPATKYLSLSATDGISAHTTVWNDVIPSDSEFTIGSADSVNADGEKIVAYVFADVEGYSKMGSYIGNGKNLGPFVYTGFRPAFIMVKSTTSGRNWIMYDNVRDSSPTNPTGAALVANVADVQFDSVVTYAPYDFLSNGFKLRRGPDDESGTLISDANTNGQTFIYMAFADSVGSFKYAHAI